MLLIAASQHYYTSLIRCKRRALLMPIENMSKTRSAFLGRIVVDDCSLRFQLLAIVTVVEKSRTVHRILEVRPSGPDCITFYFQCRYISLLKFAYRSY